MFRKVMALLCVTVCVFSVSVFAREPPAYSMLDPKPYDPAVDPDIDLFIGNWRDAMPLFGKADGLAVLYGIAPISLDPMTFGHPHSHGEGVEEVWISLAGDTRVMLGKQLRMMPVGSAYKIPPTGITAHANINATQEPIKYMWMMKLPE